jgi:hypothetical protein
MLRERFTIGHTTLQVDHAPDDLLAIQRRKDASDRGM